MDFTTTTCGRHNYFAFKDLAAVLHCLPILIVNNCAHTLTVATDVHCVFPRYMSSGGVTIFLRTNPFKAPSHEYIKNPAATRAWLSRPMLPPCGELVADIDNLLPGYA